MRLTNHHPVNASRKETFVLVTRAEAARMLQMCADLYECARFPAGDIEDPSHIRHRELDDFIRANGKSTVAEKGPKVQTP
jgi:hypothetical protein